MSTSAQPPPGLSVDGYQLVSRLGEGGMGVVHLAQRPGEAPIALKVLRPHIVGDDEARSRLAREVSSLSRIRSPWVAEIVDSDPWGDIPYVATRYVAGPSLHEQVRDEGPISGEDLHWLAHGLAEGIATVHAVGVLHRDVKPSNVLMDDGTPILIDFGLARVADDPRLTHTGWLLGTPGYLAPEILAGDDAGPASDLHSWAATVAYAGTGRPPFGRGPSMAVMDRVRRGQHDLSGLPDDLRTVLNAALDPDPRNRPELPDLLAWLREPDEFPLPTGAVDDDPYTVPLSLTAQEDPTRVFADEPDHLAPEPEVWQPPPRTPFLQRVRRAVLLLTTATGLGAAVAAYPWISLGVLLVLTWLLRSASLAASATVDRRRLRGVRWYDPVLYLIGAPWHAARSIPGTVLLALWGIGVGVAAALICYAVAAGEETTLFAAGVSFAVSLWMGPGGSRVRSPLARVVHPLSVAPGIWLAAMLVVGTAGGILGHFVLDAGINWAPGDGPPFDSLRPR